MTPPAVCLHIGAMKTGTTFVQGMLGSHHEQLAAAGIAYPTPWSDQVEAVRDVLQMKGGSHLGSIAGRWGLMVDRLHQWQGPRAILSVEFLSFADAEQIRQMVADLAPSEVTVVLGTRDLGRVLPAQWQTAVRNGRRTPYREYLDQLTARTPNRVKKHFWKRQDVGRIASDWGRVVGRSNVTVVTVPPRGSDPAELWRRFARAMGIDDFDLEQSHTSNESLGVTGTELLRRINEVADASDMSTWSYQHGINRALSHDVLPGVADLHPALGVPDKYHDWVRREAARIGGELEAAQVPIVGDLADLTPRLEKQKHVWPEELPESEILDFAVRALTAFGQSAADAKRRAIRTERRQGSDGTTPPGEGA